MDPDLQQAESERYSDKAFFVLPLDSGKIAVLGPRRELYKIVDTWDEAKTEGPDAAPKYVQKYTETRPRGKRRNRLMKERLDALSEAATNVVVNAEMVPDPRADGLVDCFLVPLEDIEALKALLLGPQPVGSDEEEQE